MAKDLVYALADCVTFKDGARVTLYAGQPWDAGDPFVKERPELFTVDNEVADVGRTELEHPVETATAGPAEKRITKKRAALYK